MSSPLTRKRLPATSTTLLKNIAGDSQHARWGEFVARYRPMMEAYMRAHFPELDADEAVQRTLIALVRALRTYHYSPEEKGAFHAYLTGMLRHRALGMVKERAREKARKESLAPRVLETRGETDSSMESVWREALLKSALQQLLADPSFSARTKEVFRRVAVVGESPATVAEDMGLARNAVDQIKSRLMAKLKKLVAALEEADRTDA